jgi:hypothetical protein
MSLDDDCARALANTRQLHLDHLRALGVTGEGLALLGLRQLPFGVERIDVDDAGRWWPAPDGKPALLIPVMERGELIDIVAFRTSAPARWWWRIGCGSLLGADLLNDGWHEDALRIVSTPLQWLIEGGNAVCVLDWSCADYELSPMRDRVELACDSAMLGARLRKRLAQPRRVPRITHATGGINVAA